MSQSGEIKRKIQSHVELEDGEPMKKRSDEASPSPPDSASEMGEAMEGSNGSLCLPDLPLELILLITKDFGLKDRIKLRSVCTRWAELEEKLGKAETLKEYDELEVTRRDHELVFIRHTGVDYYRPDRRRWMLPSHSAAVILRVLSDTCSFKKTVVELDLKNIGQSECLVLLPRVKTESVSITHSFCDEADENGIVSLGEIPPSFFSCTCFFPSAHKLELNGIYMETAIYRELYESVISSSLTHVAWASSRRTATVGRANPLYGGFFDSLDDFSSSVLGLESGFFSVVKKPTVRTSRNDVEVYYAQLTRGAPATLAMYDGEWKTTVDRIRGVVISRSPYIINGTRIPHSDE